MNKTRFHISLLTVLAVLFSFAGNLVASPVPLLESERTAIWHAAWETAWEIAWETPAAFTVEFSGDVQGDTPLDLAIEFTEQSMVGESLDINWGLSVSDAQMATAALVASFGLPWADERAYLDELRVGKLYVETSPMDASVRLLNADKTFKQGMDLTAGSYVIEVARNGFEPQVRRVEVLAGMAATVRMDLVQVAQVGAPMNIGAGYMPPADGTATSEQLAKQLATPASVQSVSQTASAPAVELSRPAAVGSLQLAAADSFAPGGAPNAGAARNLENASPASGTLRVNTVPPEAEVRILSIKPKFEQGIALEAGRYTIDAQLYGYATVTREVAIEPGRETTVDLRLEKLHQGRLFVKTTPENAHIRILDIRPRFHQGMNLAEGVYTIDATISGYETEVREVEVKADTDTVVELSLNQVKPTGRLYVDTSPENAAVRVLGILPVFHQGMELAAGTYTIDAAVDGQEPREMEITIKAGQDNRYAMALDTAQPSGHLFVQTVPAGATVRVLNIAPRFEQGMALRPGAYTIDAAIEGYETTVREVAVLADKETRVTVELQSRNQDVPDENKSVSVIESAPIPVEQPESVVEEEPVALVAALPEIPVMQEAPAAVSDAPLLPAPLPDTPQAPTAAGEELVFNDKTGDANIRAFDIEVFLSMAQLALNAGDYMGAIEAAQHVLDMDAASVQAYKTMSLAQARLGQYEDALKILEKGLAVAPHSEELRLVKQDVVKRREQRDQKESTGSTAISLDPGYKQVYEN